MPGEMQGESHKTKPKGYTTALKMLQIMTEKALSGKKSTSAELKQIEKLLDKMEGGSK